MQQKWCLFRYRFLDVCRDLITVRWQILPQRSLHTEEDLVKMRWHMPGCIHTTLTKRCVQPAGSYYLLQQEEKPLVEIQTKLDVQEARLQTIGPQTSSQNSTLVVRAVGLQHARLSCSFWSPLTSPVSGPCSVWCTWWYQTAELLSFFIYMSWMIYYNIKQVSSALS